MPANYVFQPKNNFLQMEHTNLFSSIRKPPYQPLFWIKNNITLVFTFFYFYRKNKYIYFRLCSYVQKMTLNLIETLKTSICNSKHTNITKIHFRNIFYIFKNQYLQKLQVQKSVFYADLYDIISILCWGPRSLTSLNLGGTTSRPNVTKQRCGNWHRKK